MEPKHLFRVIVADDEREIREGLEEFISAECPDFTVAGVYSDGHQALEHLKARGGDMLITDISMPNLSGLDAVEEIKRFHPNLAVILITGYRDFEYAKRALDLGVSQLIVKPVDFAELLSALKNAATELNRRKEQAFQDTRRILSSRMRMRNYLRLAAAGFLNPETVLQTIDLPFLRPSCAKVNFRCADENIRKLFGGDSVWQDMCEIQNERIDAYCINEEETSAEFFVLYPEGHEEFVTQFIEESTENLQKSFGATVETCHSTFGQVSDIGGQHLDNVAEALVTNMLDEHIADKEILVEMIMKILPPDLFGQLIEALLNRLSGEYEIDTEALRKEAGEVTRWDGGKMTGLLKQAEEQLLGHFLACGNRIKKIKEYMAAHCDGRLSLHSVADAFSLNPNYLSQLFRRETGERFGYYVSRVKIEKAKQLLRDTDWNLRAVAEAVGYSGEEYFSRIFKEHTGLAPKQYANLMITGSGEKKE